MKNLLRAVISLFCVAAVVFGLFVGWLLYTPWGARFTIRQIGRVTLGSHKVSWQALEGSLARGISVQHLQVLDIPRLPPGSFLRVQTLSVRLIGPIPGALSIDIDNARLFPYGDESIVVNAKVRGDSFTANVYTRSLDLGAAREILLKFFDVPPMKGSLRDIDLVAGGFFSSPWVEGRLIAERIVQNEFVLEECPVRVDLQFVRGGSQWETHGHLELSEGWLQSPAVRVDLLNSRLTFTGRLSKPELDINATSRVARTRIDIKVTGSRDNPKIALTSDEPYSKEQLLLMLATGRRWSGMEGAKSSKQMTPQLATDFIDYLLFGGSRGKVVEWFGLSDISLIADEKVQGVTLSKDVTTRFGVGYGVKVGTRSADQTQTRDVTQTVESDYQLTDRLTVSAQKELKAARTAAESTSVIGDIPDDRIFLKYRSRF